MSGADTIFALASGAGRAAVAVLRISGAASGDILLRLCGALPPARHAVLRRLRDEAGEVLDRALVLWLPGPATATGEDVFELHVHGGAAVLAAISGALGRLGARMAEPGEFSRRAFLNGRIDLLEAEAIADLIDAETDAQRRQALRQGEGVLGAQYDDWRARLLRLLAHQEALIDFPDEALPPEVEAELGATAHALAAEIEAHLADGRRGERLRNGIVFAIVGTPNVGKSSLFNALVDREAAIVSPTPGTTRDALEATLDLAGIKVTLIDTAGLHESGDPIEAEGVRRARARAASADLLVVVTSATALAVPDVESSAPRLIVVNKVDLAKIAVPDGNVSVSARHGTGLPELRARLADEAVRLAGITPQPALTRARHRAALEDAANALADARVATLPELRAEALRQAGRAIGRITGAVDIEMVLDAVFGEFCIGK